MLRVTPVSRCFALWMGNVIVAKLSLTPEVNAACPHEWMMNGTNAWILVNENI